MGDSAGGGVAAAATVVIALYVFVCLRPPSSSAASNTISSSTLVELPTGDNLVGRLRPLVTAAAKQAVAGSGFSELELNAGRMFVGDDDTEDMPTLPAGHPLKPTATATIAKGKCILLDLTHLVPPGAGAAAAGGGGGGAAGGDGGGGGAGPPAKRGRVTFGLSTTVRDVELKHRSVKIPVPDSWDLLLQMLRERCGYQDGYRLYYSTEEIVPKKMKLASADDFSTYVVWGNARELPDIWMLRAAAGVPSPEQLPTGAAAAAGGKSAASSRSSTQQADFRNAMFLRDGADAPCALCGSDSDLQAAHILPQAASDAFTTEEDLLTVMKSAKLYSLYEPRNGFLLCDQCHDFFDAYLWSVDSEQKVVIADALLAHVPEMASYKGKQLFSDVPAPEGASARPPPVLWEWHHKNFGSARDARHEKVAGKFFFCGRCNKPYVQAKSKDKHQKTCTAATVPAKHFFTPADKRSAGGGAAGGGEGS